MKKKLIERFFVEWFVRQLHWDCRVVDDENPDFGVEFQDKIIGLEVTNLYKDEELKGSPAKRRESIRGNWLLGVSKKYYEQSKLPIRVDVLSKSGDLKGDAGALASELVKRSNIGVWESKEFEFKPSTTCNLKIWMERIPDNFEGYNWWTFIDNHAGISRPVNKIVVQDIVKTKATKLQAYKERYSEVMLLIVSDRTYQSGMFHLTEEIVTPAYGFSAVYLALYPENYIRIG